MFCQLASQCYEVLQSRGLKAAIAWCQHTDMPYEIGRFLMQQLLDSQEVEEIAYCDQSHFMFQMYVKREFPAGPVPKARWGRFSKVQYLWQHRVIVSRAFNRIPRSDRRMFRFNYCA